MSLVSRKFYWRTFLFITLDKGCVESRDNLFVSTSISPPTKSLEKDLNGGTWWDHSDDRFV